MILQQISCLIRVYARFLHNPSLRRAVNRMLLKK